MTHDQGLDRPATSGTLRGVEAMGFPVDDFELPDSPDYFEAWHKEARARQNAHPDCIIWRIGGLLVWVPESERVAIDAGWLHYEGDYADALEFDDPRIVEVLRIETAAKADGTYSGKCHCRAPFWEDD